MSGLVSPSKARALALQVLQAERPHLADKKTRVAKSFIDRIEAKTRAMIRAEVVNCCSVGKTIS